LTNTSKVEKMGHIKEPKGVDFIIESKPLKEEERAAISKFIRDYKAKQKLHRGSIGKKKRIGSSSVSA
jgi:hypothetical protein